LKERARESMAGRDRGRKRDKWGEREIGKVGGWEREWGKYGKGRVMDRYTGRVGD